MTTPVNVFVRVRPLNEQECKENAENCIETGEKTVKVFLVYSDQFINNRIYRSSGLPRHMASIEFSMVPSDKRVLRKY